MNVENWFIVMLLGLFVTVANALTAFCEAVKVKLNTAKAPTQVKAMVPTTAPIATVPKESAAAQAPTLPTGVSTGAESPPVTYWFGQRIGHVSATACAQSGQTMPDPRPKHAGDILTVVGIASHNSDWLVCTVGNRAKLRSFKELALTAPVNPVDNKAKTPDAVLNTLVTHPSILSLPESAIVKAPTQKTAAPAPTAIDARTATLFDVLVSMGVPKTIASLQAAEMAKAETFDSAKLAAPTPTIVATASPASPGSKASKGQLYPLAIPSGVSRLVFWNKDGTPLNNTSGAQHSMSASGSSGQALSRGEHRLSARIAAGDIRVEYR